MKNIYFYTLLMLAVIASSCKKSFLQQEPYGNSIASATYYNNATEATSATIVQYGTIDDNAWWQLQWWRQVSGEAASDDEWIGVNGGEGATIQVAHFTLDANNTRLEAQWVELYKSIFQYNATIAGIQNSKGIDASTKAKLTAELQFLRAFQYFDLVRNWGAVPLITQTLSPAENTYTRTSANDVYAFIKKDLQSAINVLPLKSQYATTDKYRATKGAAQALLAKIDLYTEDWNDALTLTNSIIASGEYSLEPNFGDIWSSTNFNGRESLFEIQYQYSAQYPALGNPFPITSMAPTEGGWGYFTPTSDLENAYKAQGDNTRLNWTIMRNGYPVAGDPNNPIFNGDPSQCKSARYNRKIYVPRAERTPGGSYTKDHIYLRMADVYLMNAEAAAMLQNSSQALNSLKVVRSRVGLSTDMTLTGWNLINAVRNERRLELALEGDRLYDLRRWKDENGQPVINSVMGTNGSFVLYNTKTSTDPYETTNASEAQNKGYYFVAGKSNLWPIPNSEITASQGRISQNPGW